MTKVLVIDDNEDIRFTIKEICEYSRWDVAEAATGFEGVEKLKEESPNIVLVDYHLPQWNGVKTVREIRTLDKKVPIIVLTVDESYEVADKFFAAGATDFALKPIKAPDLISRIRLNMQNAKLKNNQHAPFVDKGINPETLDIIKDYLRAQKEELSISEVAKNVPISYQSVHRYLNYLVESDEVEVIAHYGKVGRPRNKYKMK